MLYITANTAQFEKADCEKWPELGIWPAFGQFTLLEMSAECIEHSYMT